MQATEYRHTDNLTVRMVGQVWGTWDALVNALMGSGLVEIGNIFGHNASEMTFAQDKHVVQAFASQTAHKTLAKCIRARRFHRGFQDVNIRPIDHMPKLLAVLLVIVPDEKARSLTEGVLLS